MVYGLSEVNMAKPYLIFRAHTGFYYAQIRLADGTLSNNKSTGCKNRTELNARLWNGL